MLRDAIDVLRDLRSQLDAQAGGEMTLAPAILERMLQETLDAAVRRGGLADLAVPAADLAASLEGRIRALYRDPLASLLDDLSGAILDYAFPEERWRLLARLFESAPLMGVHNSWHLAAFVKENWDYFSVAQRERLRPILEAAFGTFAEAAGAMTVGEILGQNYADGRALEAFKRLTLQLAGLRRSLVPYGLRRLVQATKAPEVRSAALRELQTLARSEMPEVRQEAEDALARL